MTTPLKPALSRLYLFLAVALPAMGFAWGASSMAQGVLLVIALCGSMLIVLYALDPRTESLAPAAVGIVAVLAFVAAQGAASYFINRAFDFGRFGQTYIFLIIYLFAAAAFALFARRLTDREAESTIRFVFYVLLLSGVAGILGIRPLYAKTLSVVWFPENSHYALAFLPFLLYMSVLSRPGKKWLWPLVGLVLTLLLKSLTLLVGVIAIALITLPARQLAVAALCAMAALLALVQQLDLAYYSSRIDLSRGNTNLSSLVYMHGWERAYLNLVDFRGLGVGFQQLGILGTEGEILQDLSAQGAEDLGLLDGGFVASKLVSEFGLVALAALVAYVVYFVRSVRWLRRISLTGGKTLHRTKVFFVSCVIMYFIDFFIRGTGYFSSSGFLFIASVIWLAQYRRRKPGAQTPDMSGSASAGLATQEPLGAG